MMKVEVMMMALKLVQVTWEIDQMAIMSRYNTRTYMLFTKAYIPVCGLWDT